MYVFKYTFSHGKVRYHDVLMCNGFLISINININPSLHYRIYNVNVPICPNAATVFNLSIFTYV